jgi:hypothetical protein
MIPPGRACTRAGAQRGKGTAQHAAGNPANAGAGVAEGGSWSGIAFKAYEPPLTGAERGNPAQAQDLNGSGPIGKALRNPLLGHLQIGKCGMA